ncbi:MAG: hypothetical protein LBC43_03100, partial [Bifidobacteriaceae bacterium]|nr:hypothetical protein [Bifidobacteriaceae bacterium]
NGKQTVSFVGGGQIIVKGRTRANTLGQTYQAVILDEAQELTLHIQWFWNILNLRGRKNYDYRKMV